MSRAFVDECTHLLAVKTKPAEKAVLILSVEVLCRQIKSPNSFPVSHDIFESDQHALGNCVLLKSRSLAWGEFCRSNCFADMRENSSSRD
jgi:hypothetical protein